VLAFACAGVPAALYSILGNRVVAHNRQWTWLGVTALWTAAIVGIVSLAGVAPIWAPALAYNSAYAVALAVGGMLYVTRLLRAVPT
jgi:hypothetical protein